MDKIIEVLKKCEFTTETFKQLDETCSFGVNAKTVKGKVIYESDKKITVTIRVINKTSYKILTATKNGLNSLQTKQDKTTEMNKLAICQKNGNKCCVDGEVIERSKINLTHFCVEYDGEDLIEEYHRRTKNVGIICDVFKIDAKKSCFVDTSVCRNIAHSQLKYLQGVEQVTHDECKYLDGACKGALQYANKEKVINNCFDYDINSMYSFLMARSDFSFPLTEGVEVPLDVVFDSKGYTNIVELEIYKLKIKGTHKYWVNTPDNYYTTYQIELLELLKIPYEIVGDTKLLYSEPVKSKDIFKYLDTIFDLKANGNKYAKGVLNCTWGNLSRKKDYIIPIEDLDDRHINSILQIDINKGCVLLQSPVKPYKHSTGRLKTFLLAYARLYLVKHILLPLEKKGFEIHQVNTDGFITNAKPDEMASIYPISKKMGDLKLEKEFKGKHTIKHVTRIDEFESVFDDVD